MKNIEQFGTFSPAAQKQFSETVVFLPGFVEQGQFSEKFGQEINLMGYDFFNLELSQRSLFKKAMPTFSSELRCGLRHRWTDEIESLLNILKGNKHILSLSYPSVSVPHCLARRSCYDVTSWMSDGGPFGKIPNDLWNLQNALLKNSKKSLSLLQQAIQPAFLDLVNYRKDLDKNLASLPQNFPILNVRGWRDKIAHFADIDLIFNQHRHLGYETFSLPEAAHLDGPLNFSQDYFNRVKTFLGNHSQKL